MPTKRKIQHVQKLTEKAQKAKSIIFAEHKGVKHKQLEELRKALRKVNSELVVAKNRLLLRAIGDRGEKIKDSLQYDTAAVFSYGDEISGVKELIKFLKNVKAGKAKSGLLGETPLTTDDINRLASLPSKGELIAKLVGQLNAPIYGLHYTLSWNIRKLVWGLQAVKEKKSS